MLVCWCHSRGGGPAYAVVLAGGYADDEDHGTSFIYSGEGGQSAGRQVSVLVSCHIAEVSTVECFCNSEMEFNPANLGANFYLASH